MKKAISLLLSLALALCLVPAAFAADSEANAAAEALHALGLFQGKDTAPDGTPVYALDDMPTRHEAVTMLVRLLGKEAEAKAGTWEVPFSDVAEWAKPYIGYAYANGLAQGMGDGTFGGAGLVTASQYLTFVLRALGYDSSTDFKWNAAWELSDRLGITHGQFGAASEFRRGDVAVISVNALSAALKGAGGTLADRLVNEGVFTAEQYEESRKGRKSEQQMELFWATEPMQILDRGSGQMAYVRTGDLVLNNIPEHIRGCRITLIDRTEGNREIDHPGGGYFGGSDDWRSVADIPLIVFSETRFQVGHSYALKLDLIDSGGNTTGETAEMAFSFTEQTLGPAYETPSGVHWSPDGKPLWTAEASDLVALRFEARNTAWGIATRESACMERVMSDGSHYQWLLRQAEGVFEKFGPGTEVRFCVRIFGDDLSKHNYSEWSEWSDFISLV